MKILFAGDTHLMGRGHQRLQALRDLGHEVAECAFSLANRPLHARSTLWERSFWKLGVPIDAHDANARLVQMTDAMGPDILWVEKGNVIHPKTLAKIKEIRPETVLVSYSEDNMFAWNNRSFYYTFGLKHYDVVFTTKSCNCNPKELPKLGAKRVIFHDNAYDRLAHQPIEVTCQDISDYGSNVGFIGTCETARAQSMLFLAKQGIQVRVWGAGWSKWVDKHPNLIIENWCLYGNNYRKAICATKINLCFLRKKNRDLQTSRTMEIPACRAFMLGERTDEHLRLFKEDVEAAYFGSNAELLDKVCYYLANDNKRHEIAIAGRHCCETSGYSHHDRLYWMLAQL